jgi:hypothetical protein
MNCNMPNPCGRLNHTLQLLVDAVQVADADIETSIKAWETLRLSYKEVHKGSRETVQSFESWAYRTSTRSSSKGSGNGYILLTSNPSQNEEGGATEDS